MSSYGSNYSNPTDSASSSSADSASSSSERVASTNLNITRKTPVIGASSSPSINIPTSSNRSTAVLSGVDVSTPSSMVAKAQRMGSQFEYQITLQYTTKTNFAYDQSDIYETDALLTSAAETAVSGIPVYRENELYGIKSKTVFWTIGSNAPIIYGYHLDGTPFVHDNSLIDNGGIHLISVTDSDGGPRTEKNGWYEDVEISRTAINPDNGKVPTEHIGQISRGSQESDIIFTYDDSETGVNRYNVEIALKPWQGIPDYQYSSIPTGRGYEGYKDADGNELPTALSGIPGIEEKNTVSGSAEYGQGRYTQSYCYVNYYDGRGQMISNNALQQLPRDQVTDANVAAAEVDTINPGNVGWLAAYRDAENERGAPWTTEGQWLTVEEVGLGFYGDNRDNTTGYNYLTVSEGLRGNRTAPGTGSLPPTVAYDFAVTNSGLIKDRDGIERWSGQWSLDARESNDPNNPNSAQPYKLKPNDLIVTQVSHWDSRGVEQFRNYCRQRYELNVILEATPGESDPEDFTWYRTGKKFPRFPEVDLPLNFNNLLDGTALPENTTNATNFRDYEKAQLNKYAGDGKDNNIDSLKGWGMLCSKNARFPFIDMTACLSVVPSIQIPADFDGSGAVDGDDLLQILANWGSTPKDSFWRPELDLNGDGIVDGNDLSILLSLWTNLGVSLVDYSKTFRPPLNWDPTDRGSVPYIEESDDVDEYTIDGPGAKPLGSKEQETIPVGQIGYPNKAMDGGTAQAWEIYTADPNEKEYNDTGSEYPVGLQMTISDTYWPELKIATKAQLVGAGIADDPDTWEYQCTMRRIQALSKALPKYLRLGGSIIWQTAAQSDNRVQGCHGGYDTSISNYGSQEGCDYELLAFMAFDKNLDPENLDRAIRSADDPDSKNISPSLSWLRTHYGSDWDKKPGVDSDGNVILVPKREGFNLRHVIRRTLTQRAIDIYGGYRSSGKYINHNAGHTDWWDILSLVGLSCTQYPDWFDMLNTGSIGSKKNGTYKDFSHQVAKTDVDYTYGTMNNRGTFPGDIGHMGPEGMANLTNIPGGENQGNGLGAYVHNTLRFKDLSVKAVNDFTIIPYPDENTGSNNMNEYPGEQIQPQNLPDIFVNQLITVYPPVGGQCGNQYDNLYYKLKEIVEKDRALLLESPNDSNLAQATRDRKWRGLYTQDIQNADSTIQHKQGDDVTTWVGTDTEDKPWGSSAPVTDQPLNNLQSGVEPEWIADVDKPYSFLVKVPDENIIRYDNEYFNVIRIDDQGNETTNGNYYKPHKDLWKHIQEDFRPIDRYDSESGCDNSYGLQYISEALEGANLSDTKFAPLTGIYPRGYDPGFADGTHWAQVTNQDFMSSNYHRGLYVKNTTLNADGTKSANYGKISLVVASISEHIRNSECVLDEAVKTTPTLIDDVGDMNPGKTGIEIEGARETINGKNDNTDLGPTARAMNFLILDDIGLTDSNGVLLPNATVDIAHNLDIDFADRDVPMPGVNSWANGGGYGNLSSFGGFKSYDYVYTRGTFIMGMAARMFTGIKDEAKQGSDKVRHKPLSDILDALPAYYAKLFVKYPTFWNNPTGRSIIEEDTNTTHTIFAGGNAQGVEWNDGRTDTKLKNVFRTGDNFYGGDQWPELMRAMFNQELLGRISGSGPDETQVASKWRDPTNGRKWCISLKEKLWRWKNEPGVIGKVMRTNNNGQLDFEGADVIQLSDPPENITALAKSDQGTSILFRDFTYTFDTLDGQQATMSRNNSNQAGANFGGTIPTTETPSDEVTAGTHIPNWGTHNRVFNKDANGNYSEEKTNFSSPSGLSVYFTVLGKNSSGVADEDKVIGRPIPNGGVTDSADDNPDTTDDNRPIAANDNDYDSYLGNDGYHITSRSGGALPYKQFVKGKSLYIWSHGINRWQELVLVSESVNSATNTITSHGPRSGATDDYSEDGFVGDPIEWEQVWVLPNETTVWNESSEPKALAVWANLASSFALDGLDHLTVFYADPQ